MVFMGFWRAVKRELRREGEGEEAELPSPACFAGTLSAKGRGRKTLACASGSSRGRVDSLNARVDCMAQGLLAGECFGVMQLCGGDWTGARGRVLRCGIWRIFSVTGTTTHISRTKQIRIYRVFYRLVQIYLFTIYRGTQV